MIFSQLRFNLREKISRGNITSFEDLLTKGREIEQLEYEYEKQKYSNNGKKLYIKCSFCGKENHQVENCFKKQETEKHKNISRLRN